MTVNISERKKSNRRTAGKLHFFELCSKVFDINETMEMWRKVWYNRVDKMNLIWRGIMTEFIVQVVIGFFIIVVGVLNTKGHISLLH